MTDVEEIWLTETDAERLREAGLYVELLGAYKCGKDSITFWKYLMYTADIARVRMHQNTQYAGMSLEDFLAQTKGD